MKLLCVITSLALLNVLVVALDLLAREVIKTNEHIALAVGSMPRIIKNIVLGSYTLQEMAFMVAVPEFPEENLRKFTQLLCQIKMQTEIMTFTGIRVPEINEDDFGENGDLTVFGNQRRIITREAIRTLILAEIRGADGVIEKYFDDYSDMCVLIGLLRSIKNPYSYIISTEIDLAKICTVTDINLNEFKYISTGGVIWELNPYGNLKQPLSDQL